MEQSEIEQTDERRLRRSKIGFVVSNKMDKTVVVKVERLEKHPLFKKYYKRSKKYFAHDAEKRCAIGDQVLIVETRPMSKLKRWRVKDIITKGEKVAMSL